MPQPPENKDNSVGIRVGKALTMASAVSRYKPACSSITLLLPSLLRPSMANASPGTVLEDTCSANWVMYFCAANSALTCRTGCCNRPAVSWSDKVALGPAVYNMVTLGRWIAALSGSEGVCIRPANEKAVNNNERSSVRRQACGWLHLVAWG